MRHTFYYILFLSSLLLLSCKGGSEDAKLHSLDDLKDKRIGVQTGSIHDLYARQHFPEAKIVYVEQLPDLAVGLVNNKFDTFFYGDEVIALFMKSYPEIGILQKAIRVEDVGIGFSYDNPQLRESFNEFLKELRESGELKEIVYKWKDHFDELDPPVQEGDGSGGILRFGTTGTDIPSSAIKDGKSAGYDVELIYRFAAKHNMKVEVQNISHAGLIAALASGKVDVIACGLIISEERKKKVAFSDPYHVKGVDVAALKKNIAAYNETETKVKAKKTFIPSLVEGFQNNILAEKRYMLIVNGLITTIVITFFSVLIGTFLGGVICLMRMGKSKFWKKIGDIYIDILAGTPILVFLMIMFYIVFAKSSITPTSVAIIALGMAFGAYVSAIYKTAIETIPRGQTEAGLSLGFTKLGTFTHIVFPQALRVALPLYKGEVIAMLKTTSIVGYIAVEDLTKAGDIIRSRTFDAFFSLIVVAIIYFALARLIAIALDRVSK